MSTVDDGKEFIEHFGTKGMRWGVRKDKGNEGRQAKTKKIDKLDKKFEKNASSMKTFIAINNKAANVSNTNDVPRINNKSQYKNQNFLKDSPLRQKYYKEHQDAFMKNLDAAATSFGTNASGTKKYSILESPDGTGWNVTTADVEHAESNNVIRIKIIFDTLGHIISLEPDESENLLNHNAETGKNFIEHYGVKGMQWGVRRSKKQLSRSSGKSTRSVKDIPDDELRSTINRMNMEQQYTRLAAGGNNNKTAIKAGAAFVSGIAMNVARQNIQNALSSKVASAMSTQAANRAARKLPYRFD